MRIDDHRGSTTVAPECVPLGIVITRTTGRRTQPGARGRVELQIGRLLDLLRHLVTCEVPREASTSGCTTLPVQQHSLQLDADQSDASR